MCGESVRHQLLNVLRKGGCGSQYLGVQEIVVVPVGVVVIDNCTLKWLPRILIEPADTGGWIREW